MRYDADGHLVYANPASGGVLKALGVAVGDRLPADVLRVATAASGSNGIDAVARGAGGRSPARIASPASSFPDR